MKLGNLDISTVKLGSVQVNSVYLGNNLVWQNAPVATAATGVGQTSFTANWNAYTGAVYYLLDVSEVSDFSTFVYENQVTTSTSYVVIGLNPNTTYYYRVRASTEYDADAQAFFDRVSTAGGTLSTTEKAGVDILVGQMKTDGIWSKMKAIYPMVGASAAACAQNLKSSSFTGSFTSGWTFASTGVTGNGSSTSMITNVNPSNDLSQNDVHISFYSRTDNNQAGVDMGTSNMTIQYYAGALYYRVNQTAYNNLGAQPSDGFSLASRIVSTTEKLYIDGSLFNTATKNSTLLDNTNITLGSWPSAQFPTDREYAFASIGDGLTDTEASDFYDAVQAFQTTLSREV